MIEGIVDQAPILPVTQPDVSENSDVETEQRELEALSTEVVSAWIKAHADTIFPEGFIEFAKTQHLLPEFVSGLLNNLVITFRAELLVSHPDQAHQLSSEIVSGASNSELEERLRSVANEFMTKPFEEINANSIIKHMQIDQSVATEPVIPPPETQDSL